MTKNCDETNVDSHRRQRRWQLQWYQSLFGPPARRPEHDYFRQIKDADGTVLLCLHQWGHDDRSSLINPELAIPAAQMGHSTPCGIAPVHRGRVKIIED